MLPAGRYYIGDLCYLPQFQKDHNLWSSLLDRTDCLQSVDGYFEVDGVKFFSSSTKYGDGRYYDQCGRAYPVDAGLIGAYPVPGDVVSVTGGHIIEFTEPFGCDPVSSDDHEGVICIDGILIITGDSDEDDDLWEDWEEEEDWDENDDY